MLTMTMFAAAAISPLQAPYARNPDNVVVPVSASERQEQEEWGYADAVIDGDRIWLSGVVAGLRLNETMADQEAAYDRAFRRLEGVLRRAGSSFDGVVEITTFHTDLPTQIDAFKKVNIPFGDPDLYVAKPKGLQFAPERLLQDGSAMFIQWTPDQQQQVIFPKEFAQTSPRPRDS